METKIYKELAKIANEVFNNIECAPGVYTAADIAKEIRLDKEYSLDVYTVKSRYFAQKFTWRDDYNPETEYTAAVGSFSCTVSGWGVFVALKRMQTAWKISAKDKVVFEREQPKNTAAVVVSFNVPATAKEIIKAINKDNARSALNYICVDTRRRALVACNGRILNAVAVPDMYAAPGAKERYLITPQLLKTGKGTVTIHEDGAAENGREVCAGVNENYPSWGRVVPAVCEDFSIKFDRNSFKSFLKNIKAGSAFNKYNQDGDVCFYIESYTNKLNIIAFEYEENKTNRTAVILPETVYNTFGFCTDKNVSAVPTCCNKMYYKNSLNPVVFVNEDKNILSLLMPKNPQDTPAEKYAFYTESKFSDDLLNTLNMSPRTTDNAAGNVATETTPQEQTETAPETTETATATETTPAAPQTAVAAVPDADNTPGNEDNAADNVPTETAPAAPDADKIQTAVAAQMSIINEVLTIHQILPGLILQHKHDKNLFVVILGTTKRGYKTKEIYFYPNSRKRAKITTKYYFALEINPGGKSLYDICPASNIVNVLAVLDKDTFILAAPVAAAPQTAVAAPDADNTPGNEDNTADNVPTETTPQEQTETAPETTETATAKETTPAAPQTAVAAVPDADNTPGNEDNAADNVPTETTPQEQTETAPETTETATAKETTPAAPQTAVAAVPDADNTDNEDNAARRFIYLLLRAAAVFALLFILPAANKTTPAAPDADNAAAVIVAAVPDADNADNEDNTDNVPTETTPQEQTETATETTETATAKETTPAAPQTAVAAVPDADNTDNEDNTAAVIVAAVPDADNTPGNEDNADNVPTETTPQEQTETAPETTETATATETTPAVPQTAVAAVPDADNADNTPDNVTTETTKEQPTATETAPETTETGPAAPDADNADNTPDNGHEQPQNAAPTATAPAAPQPDTPAAVFASIPIL